MIHPDSIGAIDLVKLHEGLRLTVYDDATGEQLRPGMTLIGHPTIGYGRALDVRGLLAAEAETLLENDLVTARYIARDFADHVWASLQHARRIVLIDMAHNLGRGGLFKFVRFRAALQAGDYEQAAVQMMASKWATQVGRRAVRLCTMMRTGEMPADVLAEVEAVRREAVG